jgi:threonine dehydrogenase-like Zn-dependent dehydrogenase
MSAEAAALAETLSVAVRALGRARLEAGDRVAVFGGGAVGLLTVQAARAMGAGRVTLIEPLAPRRVLGLDLGADEAFHPGDLGLPDPDDGPPGSSTGEGGFDVVVECSGVASAVLGAIAATRRAGRVALVGIGTARPPLDAWDVVAKEKEIIGSFSHVRERDFVGALGMLSSSAISLRGLVTRVPLSQSLEGGLLALADHPESYLKIVVVPDEA